MVTTVLFDVHSGRCDPDRPSVFYDDLSVVRGDGIFETLLVRDGKVCNLTRHLARFKSGATLMDLPDPPLEMWCATINSALAAWVLDNGDIEGMMRLVYTRGRESDPAISTNFGRTTAHVMILEVGQTAALARAEGVTVCLLERGYSVEFAARAPWQLIGVKTLSYATNMAALRYAHAAGYDDAVYISSDGKVLEGSRSSVVVVHGRKLTTVPTEAGILPGTTVSVIFELARKRGWECNKASLTPRNLQEADSVWLCSSVTVAARVTRIDEKELFLSHAAANNATQFAELAASAIRAE